MYGTRIVVKRGTRIAPITPWTDEQWTENGDHKIVDWKTRDWDTQMTAQAGLLDYLAQRK